MFSPLVTMIAVAVLVALCIGALIYTVFFEKLAGQARADKRVDRIAQAPARTAQTRQAAVDSGQRRKNIQSTLKEIESKQKKKNRGSVPLNLKLQQAGLNWKKKHFFVFSVFSAIAFFAIGLLIGANIYVALGLLFVGLVGFPRWFVNFKIKRRQNKFIDELPNALDVIIRGIKSGLPVGDCLRIIASEAAEPVRSEFKLVVESQTVGLNLSDAIGKIYERVPIPEANFLGIVIGIQQKAGGNLSEALTNLSKVLRERKRMTGKIKAMAAEAKASAGIIGCLPPAVMLMVYATTPSYIMTLFTTTGGNAILVVSALWMFTGVMVMRKMINFDF